MFWVRFRSAVILVIITLAALIVGEYLLFGILLAVSMIGVRELYKVFKIENSILGIMGYIGVAAWYAMLLFELLWLHSYSIMLSLILIKLW